MLRMSSVVTHSKHFTTCAHCEKSTIDITESVKTSGSFGPISCKDCGLLTRGQIAISHGVAEVAIERAVKPEYCTQSVWANGDTEDCRTQTLGGDLCKEHLAEKIYILRAEVAQHQAEIVQKEAQIWVLSSRSQRTK